MENLNSTIEQNRTHGNGIECQEENDAILKMEDFHKKHFKSESNKEGVKVITLEDLRELKENGITTENFLDYLCQTRKILLHGSIHEISYDKLKSRRGKIFASNRSAIAIMRSLYSNVNVNLEYPLHNNAKIPVGAKSSHTARW